MLACLSPEAAKALGVGRVTLSKLLNKKSGISPEMAVSLSIALNTSSEMWTNMQAMYNLWHAEKKRSRLKAKIKKLKLYIGMLHDYKSTVKISAKEEG